MEGSAVEKSAEELQREIDELYRRQREITERLRDPRGLRKGNVLGTRNPGAVRPMGSGMPQRGVARRPDDLAFEAQPPAKKRLLSTVVKVSDEQTEKDVSEKPNEQLEKVAVEKVEGKASVQMTTRSEAEEGQIDSIRPNSQPFYPLKRDTRRGNKKFLEPDLSIVEPLPRVLTKEDNPNLEKRNRRMFGALLGTLERFRQEDKQLSASEAYLRRSDSLKRAEERAQEESERLRQQEREQLAEKRRRDLTLRARLAAKAEEKQLELLFIQWTEHHSKLCKFLRTKSEPHIFYMPKASGDLDKVLENQQKDLLEWKNMRREELTKYQKEVSERHLANVEAEIQRWQSGASRRNSANIGLDNGSNEDAGKALSEGPRRQKARVSGEEHGGDEDIEDMADDDIVGSVLEEDDNKEEHESERDLKGVVEYLSGDDDAINR